MERWNGPRLDLQDPPKNKMEVSKKSPTVGPTERTPNKPEYLIARSQLTKRGPLVRSHSSFDGRLAGLSSSFYHHFFHWQTC